MVSCIVPSSCFQSAFKGIQLERLDVADKTSISGEKSSFVDVGDWLSNGKKLLVFGTYAADFNAIEYSQRLRYYWPLLRDEKGFDDCALILNCRSPAARKLADCVDLPTDVTVLLDHTGEAGRTFGVGRGWLADFEGVSPYVKLFGMLWGLGAWATLPAVIGGYLGNPWAGQPWIDDAFLVNSWHNRWPVVLDTSDSGVVVSNKFSSLPLLGAWKRRPLELATLRLQNMLGISLSHWNELCPDSEGMSAGVLTQLGGCVAVDKDGTVLYEWRDPGICAVANFEELLNKV